MKKNFLFCFYFLLFSNLIFCQFQVKPKVEVKMSYQNGFSEKPKRILLHGKNLAGEYRAYWKTFNFNHNNIFYNVEPGVYLLSLTFSDSLNQIYTHISEFHFVLHIDKVSGEVMNIISIQNKIKIKPNRNYKIDLIFVNDPEKNGFYKRSDKQFNNFDYTEFYFSYTQHIIETKNTRSLNSKSQNSIDYCSDTPGDFQFPIGAKCQSDGGLINLNVNNLVIKNEGVDYKGTGFRKGDWGITKVTLLKTETAEPNYECILDPDCKCKLVFDYDIKIEVETKIYDKSKLPNTVLILNPFSGQKETVSLYSQHNKDCFIESIRLHEKLHCTQHLSSIEESFISEIPTFCSYWKSIVCKLTDDCKSKWTSLNTIANARIHALANRVITKDKGEWQEPFCELVDFIYFFNCIKNK